MTIESVLESHVTVLESCELSIAAKSGTGNVPGVTSQKRHTNRKARRVAGRPRPRANPIFRLDFFRWRSSRNLLSAAVTKRKGVMQRDCVWFVEFRKKSLSYEREGEAFGVRARSRTRRARPVFLGVFL